MELFYTVILFLLHTTFVVASPRQEILQAAPQISAGSIFNFTISSDGLNRSYLLSIPPKYYPGFPTPVILSYHGGTKTAEDQLELDQLTNPEFNTHAIVVYPQGIDDKWQGVPGVTVNDVQFTSDILDEISLHYSIDLNRIWATGKSDGGGFCNVLACDTKLSQRIAAFAPVSGAYYIDTLPCVSTTVVSPCQAGRLDIPFLAFHGGNDTTIAFDGGERKNQCLPAIPHYIREWAARDLLSVQRNKSYPISSSTTRYSFGPRGLVGLVYDAVIGHDWPSTVPNSDNQKAGHILASFNATPIIMDFFGRHSLLL